MIRACKRLIRRGFFGYWQNCHVFLKKKSQIIYVTQLRLFWADNFANIAKVESRAPRHRALSLPVFSPIFGQSWQWSNGLPRLPMSKGLLAILAMVNGLPILPMVRPTDARPPAPPGMDCYADQISQSFCLLDRFCFQLFAGEAPPRADGLAGRSRWVHKKFFYFYQPHVLIA